MNQERPKHVWRKHTYWYNAAVFECFQGGLHSQWQDHHEGKEEYHDSVVQAWKFIRLQTHIHPSPIDKLIKRNEQVFEMFTA